MDLENALKQFDITEANLRRLETVWSEMMELIPDGPAFISGSPEDSRYQELKFAFRSIVKALPSIDGYSIESEPLELNVIGHARLDALDIGEIHATIALEEEIFAPSREIQEYRRRLSQARRELVREHLVSLIGKSDTLLSALTSRLERNREPVEGEDWERLKEILNQIERLVGSSIPRKGRWKDLRRHIAWGQGVDLYDIAEYDWPSVRSEIENNLYSELEPLPMEVEDLVDIVESRPRGPVSIKLQWSAITPEEFERLLFNIVSDAEGYANPRWLMDTNASDRGRDISVERIIGDTISGQKTERVIIQAKHWRKKSVSAKDVSEAANLMALWEPPRVHTLIIATSGRFTADAVDWIERHNGNGNLPHIEMWPESHLELLLAQRPNLAAEFKLR